MVPQSLGSACVLVLLAHAYALPTVDFALVGSTYFVKALPALAPGTGVFLVSGRVACSCRSAVVGGEEPTATFPFSFISATQTRPRVVTRAALKGPSPLPPTRTRAVHYSCA